MLRKTLPLACLFAACLSTPSADAQVYRWKDDQGRTHMGDRPPVGVNAHQISDKKAPTAPDPNEQQQALERRDAWQRVLRSSPDPTMPEQPTARSRPGPDRGAGSDAAPQGNCAYYQHLLRSLAEDGGLRSCKGSQCAKADANEVAMVRREASAACAKR